MFCISIVILVVPISTVSVKDFAISSAVISSQHASMENCNLRVPTSKDTNFHNIWCSVKYGKVSP